MTCEYGGECVYVEQECITGVDDDEKNMKTENRKATNRSVFLSQIDIFSLEVLFSGDSEKEIQWKKYIIHDDEEEKLLRFLHDMMQRPVE